MRKAFLVAAGAVMISALMFGCSKQEEPKEAEQETEQTGAATVEEPADDRPHATANTVFGFPEQVDAGVGTVAVFQASSDECTRENLETWCNQYVRWGVDAWCVIEYTDRPGYGVYAIANMVEANVQLDSDYMLSDDSEETVYVFDGDNPEEYGTLTEL